LFYKPWKERVVQSYAEAVELFWFNDGLCGRDIGMSEDTYKRGLCEFLDEEFLAPAWPVPFGSTHRCSSKAIAFDLLRNMLRKRNDSTRVAQAKPEIQHELEL
jgi:hypothetical protein